MMKTLDGPQVGRPNAWVLDFGGAHRAAVGTRVLVHLIDNPKTYSVPYTPSHCRYVLPWHDRLLPVVDVAARLGAVPRKPRLVAVACYRDRDEGVRFGALTLAAPPVPAAIANGQQCSLPEQPEWQELAASCADFMGAPVPILHLGRVFSAPELMIPVDRLAATG
jgi:hypothetical protein